MKKYLNLLRAKNYVKNFLIFIPYIFSGKIIGITNAECIKLILGFIIFSLMSSCVYIINDIKDVENDRKHPEKKKRAIASGEVSILSATIISIFLLSVSVILSYSISVSATIILVIYLILNLLYTFYLKEVPIMDLLCLALFFVLRIYYGGALFDIVISDWLFLTTLFASLYFGVGKRRKEIKNLQNGNDTRLVLKYYNEDYLQNLLNIFLGLIIMCYSLWIINGDFAINFNVIFLKLSIIEIIVVLLKYHLNLYSDKYGETPVDIFLKDKKIFLLSAIFVLTVFGAIFV